MVLRLTYMLFAAVSQLTSVGDYIFAPFKDETNAASWIEGRIMGTGIDYRVLRAEDVSYIDEAWAERRALSEGQMPSTNSFNIVTNGVLKKAYFEPPGYNDPTGGYFDETPELQSGQYEIERNALTDERIAKLDGGWCILSNIYWWAENTNRLANPITASNIVRNLIYLSKARKMSRHANRANRSYAGQKHYTHEQVSYSGSTVSGKTVWTDTSPSPVDTTTFSTFADEYYSARTAQKHASLHWVTGATAPDMSPPESYLTSYEYTHTGRATRVEIDLGIDSEVVTTGGITRITGVVLYSRLAFRYYRIAYNYGVNGYEYSANTNVNLRYIYSTPGTLVATGGHALAYFDIDAKTLCGNCMEDKDFPKPLDLSLSELADPEMYVRGNTYDTSTSYESRQTSIYIDGYLVAILTCIFKTAQP